jgi:hypothetical protein
MKTLLRTAALVAALAFAALAAGKATEVPGSCYTLCRSNTVGGPQVASATWTATYRQCCFGFSPPRPVNPCPPGFHYVDGEAVYTSPTGSRAACPA